MFSFFERQTNPFPPPDTTAPPSKLWAFLLYYCEGFKWPLFLIMFTGTLVAALEVMLFGFLGSIVDWLSGRSAAEVFSAELPKLLLMGLVVLVLLPALNALGALVRQQMIMGNMPMAIRWRIHNYLLGQSLSFYQDEFSGRVSSRVMQTALAIREVATICTDILVYALVYFTSIIVLMAAQHWLLMLLMLGWMVCYGLLLWYFLPRLRQASEEQSGARSLMTGRITDAYTNIATVKLFSHSRLEANYAKSAMGEFLQTVYQQMRLANGLGIGLTSLNYLLLFVITASGLLLWRADILSVGGIAIASALALRLNGMSQWIMWEIGGLFEAIGTVDDGRFMLSRPINVVDKKDAPPLVVSKGEIDFVDVSFNYNRNRPGAILDHLNLHIKAGEKIGLVGRSGAGKSTLVNALLRFYDLSGGKILIDGQDISQVSQDSLRAHIAVVSQDTSLLHRSIRDNVLYGRPDASEEEVIAALRQAEAWDFLDNLTDPQGRRGLDAQVGERGVKLSGGQRQRIAIARVLLKNAPILILDEATSALDSEVESAIQTSLLQLMAGKTVIAIAHRLSTIAQLDRLIVLDRGRVVEEGSHGELLARGGIYAQLWNRQTGGYLGD